jgi:hypothetical protein
MSCTVYANCNEIACKASDNKVIADMPDVCLSPPSPPAGPVPVPYPDTSFSKDMQNGSKTVLIGDKEIMLKDQSFYKTSPLGDEAATNSFGANVVTHVITGKTYCVAWSMDIQFEGQNVDRHSDLTTSNHASDGTTTAPLITLATVNAPKAAKNKGQITPDPAVCNGQHSWDCNTFTCAKCWPKPGCRDNADQCNESYNQSQSGSADQRVADKHQEDAARDQAARAAGNPNGDTGARMESAAVRKAIRGGETIEHIGYRAHCSRCHFQQEVDLVTSHAIKEVKASADGFSAAQTNRIRQIRDECFPKKDLKMVTAADQVAEVETRKLGLVGLMPTKPGWPAAVGPKGVSVEDP